MSEFIHFPSLEIKIEQDSDSVTYTFVGDVDENFDHQRVLQHQVDQKIQKNTIIFKLAEINNFNSCGIREWSFFVKEISKMSKLILKECSVPMVDQINMIPDSMGTGKIESFYAPYYCECAGEVNQLIDVNQYYTELEQRCAPNFSCQTCGKNLDFDALEESYFMFLDGNVNKAG